MLTLELKGLDGAAEIFPNSIVSTAAMRSVNRAVDRGRSEATRALYARWNLKKADINRAVKTIKAQKSDHGTTTYLSAVGRPISLTYFGAKWFRPRAVVSRQGTQQRKRATGKSGVYYQVLRGGGQEHKPHAFIAKTRSGHFGVFERLGKGSLPIDERKVITIASMFGQQNIFDPVLTTINQTWEAEFPRQLALLLGQRR